MAISNFAKDPTQLILLENLENQFTFYKLIVKMFGTFKDLEQTEHETRMATATIINAFLNIKNDEINEKFIKLGILGAI